MYRCCGGGGGGGRANVVIYDCGNVIEKYIREDILDYTIFIFIFIIEIQYCLYRFV